jgi:hypothetical protein
MKDAKRQGLSDSQVEDAMAKLLSQILRTRRECLHWCDRRKHPVIIVGPSCTGRG